MVPPSCVGWQWTEECWFSPQEDLQTLPHLLQGKNNEPVAAIQSEPHARKRKFETVKMVAVVKCCQRGRNQWAGVAAWHVITSFSEEF